MSQSQSQNQSQHQRHGQGTKQPIITLEGVQKYYGDLPRAARHLGRDPGR